MTADLRAARRQLVLDSLGIAVSAIGFALVFGLSARNAGYTLIETSAMSVFAFAGAAQFAAVGYVAQGLPWLPIVVLTFFLNARHRIVRHIFGDVTAKELSTWADQLSQARS